MLLKVKQPDVDNVLEKINSDIVKIFWYLCQSNDTPFKNKSVNKIIWFSKIRKSKSVDEAFKKILKWDKESYKNVYWALINDISYLNESHFNRKSDNQFVFNKLDEKIRNELSDFFESLYKRLMSGKGYREVMNSQDNITGVQYLRTNFISENSNLRSICPSCLGVLKYRTNKEIDNLADIDHFFPKSKFATLTFDSKNLIPICGECNKNFKKSIVSNQAFEIDELNNLFIPYRDSGIDRISTQISNLAGQREYVISSKNKFDLESVKNLKRIYKLEIRWSSDLSSIYRSIVADLKEDILDEGIDDIDELIKTYLKRKIRRFARERKTIFDSYKKLVVVEFLYDDGFKPLVEELKLVYNEEKKM